MLTVYLLAGPNGTGKTTFYSLSLKSGFIPQDLPFINVDLIAQGLGGYTAVNYALAPEICLLRSWIVEVLNIVEKLGNRYK